MVFVDSYRMKRQRGRQLARGSRAGRGRLAVEAAGARFVSVGTVGSQGAVYEALTMKRYVISVL